jgi:hypothetical protein
VIVSTLPHLGDQAFDAVGFVYAQATLGAIGGGNTQKMVQTLVAQAQQMGAAAIIDVTTVIGGTNGNCVMTGTAVRLR